MLIERIYAWRALLALEYSEEEEQFRLLRCCHKMKDLQDAGFAIGKLVLESTATGLSGKSIYRFMRKTTLVPSHKFSVGDNCYLCYSSDVLTPLLSGVVRTITDTAISVVFDEINESLDRSRIFVVLKKANEVTQKRLSKCLDNMEQYQKFPGQRVFETLFRITSWTLGVEKDCGENPLCDGLNNCQTKAVNSVLCSRSPVNIVHGPPGTGKTTVACEIIAQAVKRGEKVLVCGPSNVSVDNVILRLSGDPYAFKPGKVVRIGHPARVFDVIHQFTLDFIVNHSEHSQIISSVRKDCDSTVAGLTKTRNGDEKRRLRQELKALKSELKTREKKVLSDLIASAQVVVSTLTSCHNEDLLRKADFDLVVIDECCQAVEVASWMALLWGKRCVLLGDHCQLPPTILSEQAAREGLAISLIERILRDFPEESENVTVMLMEQYRMNELIMQWSSKQFYKSKLIPHNSVKNHCLSDLDNVELSEETENCLFLIDTDGTDMEELQADYETSKANPGECQLVYLHVKNLVNQGVQPCNIAVISPYNLQISLLKSALREEFRGIEIRSVDGFQGQEKEAVVLSLVRSNQKGELGFLAEHRRLNVAVTRGRRHVAVICDSRTVGRDSVLKSLLDHIRAHGVVKSAFEYDLTNAVNVKPPETATELSIGSKGNSRGSEKPGKNKRETTKRQQAVPTKRQQAGLCNSTNLSTMRKENTEMKVGPSCSIDSDEVEILLKQIEDFRLDESAHSLSFSPDLNAYLRKIVHEESEKYGLHHFSCGEKHERFVTISKTKQTENGESFAKESSLTPLSPLNPPMENSSSSVQNIENLPKHECPKVKKKKKIKGKSTPKDTSSEENEKTSDLLLEKAIRDAKRCSFDKCKASIHILGQQCRFCHCMFCFTHVMAEIHGCGEEAKRFAKQERVRELEGLKKQSCGSSEKRERIHQKLSKQLEDMQNRRKGSTNKKK